jgi:AP-3 complex subunit delta
LGKKLAEPLSDIISNTKAKSLQYECIQTVTRGMLQNKSVVKLAVSHLKDFIVHPDQNRK